MSSKQNNEASGRRGTIGVEARRPWEEILGCRVGVGCSRHGRLLAMFIHLAVIYWASALDQAFKSPDTQETRSCPMVLQGTKRQVNQGCQS